MASVMIQRAYSQLCIKSVDGERRQFEGVATTPTVDRVDDIVESKGAKYTNPMPLLLFHDHTRPVGRVRFNKPTDDGITFTADIPEIDEPGPLRDRVQEAWQSIKAGLIRGVSIGFKPLKDGIELLSTGGIRYKAIEIFELSLVAIPANAEATITAIKSIDAAHLAASGDGVGTNTPGDSGTRVVTTRKAVTRGRSMTIQEKKQAFVTDKEAKVARLNALAAEDTLDASQQEEFDNLTDEVKGIDTHLARLDKLDEINRASLKPVESKTIEQASFSRSSSTTPTITVKTNLPPGIGFARAVMCKAAAWLEHRSPDEIARRQFPDHSELHAYLAHKAAVPAGTSTQAVWASPLVYAQNLESEFIEFLRPATIIGRIPGLRMVPFNVRIPSQTGGGTGYWVGEGAPKPLTSFAFSSTSLTYTKVAAIAVITQELARFSSPNAETLVRDALRDAVVERIDIDFIDPTEAAVANVKPASITNGLTPLTSAGVSADNARTDIGRLLQAFLNENQNVEGLVLIMPSTLAMALSIMVNSLGQPQFPGLGITGGNLMGVPVITSQYAANRSGAGNLVIALNARELFLADDGQVTVDASTEASLQMLDNPTNNSSTANPTTVVSMYQTNSIALRAERFINWAKRRAEAVVYMDDVNWGSVGSPS